MPGEGLCVRVVRCLQFWKNSVMIVVWRCRAFVFGTPADSQEQVEDYITSDGGTASPSDATSQGEWEEITTALTADLELQISNNIDPAGEFKVTLAHADEASQPTDAALTRASAQCLTPPPRRSLEDSTEPGTIITAQRTPDLAVQDVKIGKEVLVMNTCFVKITDKLESLNQMLENRYDSLFRKFGKPELDNPAAGGLPVEAKPFNDPGHVPLFVSEGIVSTFAMHVDKLKATLVPSQEERRIAAGEGAEVLANLKQTPPTQKNLQMENDSSDSLGQGSSSSSFM